jgi:hypothetical protein
MTGPGPCPCGAGHDVHVHDVTAAFTVTLPPLAELLGSLFPGDDHGE